MAVVAKLFLEASRSGRDDRRSIGVGIPANSDVPPITCKAFVGSAHFSLRTSACNRQRLIAQTQWRRHPRSRREVHIPISATFQYATKIHHRSLHPLPRSSPGRLSSTQRPQDQIRTRRGIRIQAMAPQRPERRRQQEEEDQEPLAPTTTAPTASFRKSGCERRQAREEGRR